MNKMRWTRLLLVMVMICWAPALSGQGLDVLLPKPQRLEPGSGMLQPRGFKLEAEVLARDYAEALGELGIKVGSYYPTKLSVRLVPEIEGAERGQDEAYTLRVDQDGVFVTATREAGAYRALQTLRQMTGRGRIPMVRITDWPSWAIRGVMHDVGRTFIPLSELKKQFAQMAHFNLNVLHWHLTENQAWRLESKAYPQLTSIVATERMPGQYYTLEEARELAEWCRQHHVLLIPEIDMPGHSAAFERAMGFGMQTPEGKAALKVILREVASVLSVPYIHIGTDEVKFTDPEFVPEMVAYTRALGYKVISWNPGWVYKPGEIDMTHLWSYRGKAQAGIPAVDSRLHYINHYDTFSDLIALYNARILRQDHGDADHAGAIIAVWNDRYLSSTRQVMGDNHLYASMLALAERGWRGGGSGYFDGRTTMLWSRQDELYRGFEDFERRLLHYKATYLSGEPIPYVRQTHAAWQIVAPFPNEGDLSRTFPPEESLKAEARGAAIVPPRQLVRYQHQGQTYQARQLTGSGFYLRHVWGEKTCPGVVERPEPNHTAYAMAWVYSPTRQKVGLMLETQNYSRSESDLPPPQGAWDYRGSRVWLNGREIAPPAWSGTHTERSNEVPLGNENASSRPPIPVELRVGWNKLMLKLPVGKFSAPETRLVKWMFAASFVSLDGREALPLRYHYLPE